MKLHWFWLRSFAGEGLKKRCTGKLENCLSVGRSWVISHVPIFHITQPVGINGLLDGYYFRWCPIYPSHGTFNNHWKIMGKSRCQLWSATGHRNPQFFAVPPEPGGITNNPQSVSGLAERGTAGISHLFVMERHVENHGSRTTTEGLKTPYPLVN